MSKLSDELNESGQRVPTMKYNWVGHNVMEFKVGFERQWINSKGGLTYLSIRDCGCTSWFPQVTTDKFGSKVVEIYLSGASEAEAMREFARFILDATEYLTTGKALSYQVEGITMHVVSPEIKKAMGK